MNNCGMEETKSYEYNYGEDNCDFCLDICRKNVKCLRCPIYKRLKLCNKCFDIHSHHHTKENENMGGDFYCNKKKHNNFIIFTGNHTGLF